MHMHVFQTSHTMYQGDNDSACNNRYSNCDVDSSGTRCMDGVCYKGDPDAFTNAYTTRF